MMLREAHSIRDTESLFIGCACGIHPAALFSRLDVCGQSKPTEGCKCPIGIHCKATQPYCRAKACLLTMGAAAWWNEPEERDSGTKVGGMFVIPVFHSCQSEGHNFPARESFCGTNWKAAAVEQRFTHPAGGNICCWICSVTCGLLFFIIIIFWRSASRCHSLLTGLVLAFRNVARGCGFHLRPRVASIVHNSFHWLRGENVWIYIYICWIKNKKRLQQEHKIEHKYFTNSNWLSSLQP